MLIVSMHEYDRSFERNWYNVCVADMAEFVVRSYTEEGAMQKVDYHCDEDKSLNLLPQDMLPHGSYAKPLEPFEESYFNRIGDSIQPVRLVAFREHSPLRNNSEEVKKDPNQLKLFSVGGIYKAFIYNQAA